MRLGLIEFPPYLVDGGGRRRTKGGGQATREANVPTRFVTFVGKSRGCAGFALASASGATKGW